MPYHFTYKEPNLNNLAQGDIIEKNDDIKNIMEEVHPHYLKDDYKYFIVLTQSCDLVRRGDKECKSKYISLAAIRPFETLLDKKINEYLDPSFKNKIYLCNNKYKLVFRQFLERLLNNNEPEYFFLNNDLYFDFPDDQVAFLKLSIAIKADLHYEKCLKAKKFELKDTFKAKLGWLVGNMYSRVGTEGWIPENTTKAQFKNRIDDIIKSVSAWENDEIINSIIEDPILINKLAKDSDAVVEHISDYKRTRITKHELLLQTIDTELSNRTRLSPKSKMTLLNVLKNDPTIRSITKE